MFTYLKKIEIDPFFASCTLFGHIASFLSVGYLYINYTFDDFPYLFLLTLICASVHYLGVSVGYHRYFTHKSFKTHRWFEIFLMLVTLFSQQRGIKTWVGRHRMHHKFTDTPKDPHIGDGGKFFLFFTCNFLMRKGFEDEQTIDKYTRDFKHDRLFQFFSSNIGVTIYIASLLYFLFFIGGWTLVSCYYISWMYVLYGTIFLVNGVTHLHDEKGTMLSKIGSRPYRTKDNTQNVLWLWPIIFDDVYHHNHHRFPQSFKMGAKSYELEIWYPLFKILEKLGVIWDLNEDIRDSSADNSSVELSASH